MLYFVNIKLAIYIHMHTCIHIYVQCLGEGKNFLFFDLNKAIILCKKFFSGRPLKNLVTVVLSDAPYYHTLFYIGVEVLRAAALL